MKGGRSQGRESSTGRKLSFYCKSSSLMTLFIPASHRLRTVFRIHMRAPGLAPDSHASTGPRSVSRPCKGLYAWQDNEYVDIVESGPHCISVPSAHNDFVN